MSDNTMVTLSKGGPAERTQPANHINIPDLWHIAQAIKHGRPILQSQREVAATRILDTWQLAHDLKRHILEAPAPTRSLATGPCYCAANENHPGVCQGADCYCHGEPGPRTDDDEPADEDDDEEDESPCEGCNAPTTNLARHRPNGPQVPLCEECAEWEGVQRSNQA